MKKIAALFLIMALVLSVCACGSDNKTNGETAGNKPADSNEQDTAQAPETGDDTGDTGAPFSFSFNGVQIPLGVPAAPIIERLGEPKSMFEAESCAFEGTDRIFYYPGFHISTWPGEGGEDFILSVTFDDDTVETDQRVYLGMSRADIIAVYGEGDQGDDSVSFFYGKEELRIFFENDRAVNIDFFYTVK